MKNVIEINESIKLNKKQYRKYKDLSKIDQWKYVMSILGNRQRGLYVNKWDSPISSLNGITRLKRQIIDVNASHSPLYNTSESLWCGVEIECKIPGTECDTCNGSGEVFNDTYDEHQTCPDCDGEGNDYWNVKKKIQDANISLCTVKEDSSISGNGVEIALLFDAAKGFSKLEKLCKIINKMDVEIDHTCGLHIHLDHRNIKGKMSDLKEHYESFLPCLVQLVSESRRENNYTKLIACDDDRYTAFNMCAIDKFNTVECRLHQGTTNYGKIKGWIELLLAIKADFVSQPSSNFIYSFGALFDRLNLKAETIMYIAERLETFKTLNQNRFKSIGCNYHNFSETSIKSLVA